MKNPLIIVVIVIALAAIGFFILSQNSSQPIERNEEVTTSNEPAPSGDQQMSGRYVEYSKQALDRYTSTRRVLFFYANWCPTCRPTDANFKANLDKIPGDVTLIRVNYNDTETDQEEKDLATKYGITYQHTFVQIDQNGEVVTKWNGGQINELLSNIE